MPLDVLQAPSGHHVGHVLSRPCAGRLGRRRTTIVWAKGGKKKHEYGSGRARLPGLADMAGLMGGAMGGADAGSSGGSASPSISSSPGVSRPTRPGSSLGSEPSSSPSSSGGGSGSPGVPAATLGEYLKFGRLLGEQPQQVQQQLELGGVKVVVDEDSVDYLQSWEQEELEAYAMFEAVVNAGAAAPPPGTAASAAARKLEKNKQRVSAAGSPADLMRGARAAYDKGVPMTAAQRKLARNKTQNGGMRASLEALMAEADVEGDADDAFELVSGQPRPSSAAAGSARLASKPARPAEYRGDDDEEEEEEEVGAFDDQAEAEYAAWAAQQEATYSNFEELLGAGGSSSGGSGRKQPRKDKSKQSKADGGLASASLSGLKGGLPDRPDAPQVPQAAALPRSGRVQLQLGKASRGPVKLAAKPQASAAARAAAQTALPLPPAPPVRKPTLTAKPSRPEPAPDAPAAAAPVPLPVPELAGNPAAKAQRAAAKQDAVVAAEEPAAAAPAVAVKPRAVAAAAPATVEPPAVAVEPKPQPKPQPDAVDVAAAAEVATPAEERAAAAAKPAAAQQDQLEAKLAADATAQPLAPAAAAVAVPSKPQRKQAAAASELQRPVAPKLQQQPKDTAAASAAQRRARNAAYGSQCLLDRRVETLNVVSTNAAGVLVRNKSLSGFIPMSLLSPAHVAAVHEQEQPLLAAAAAGAIVRQLEAAHQPPQAADGADLDTATRGGVRRQALSAALLGQQLAAVVVNVDEASGRVVLSERAAGAAGKERSARTSPPTAQELQAVAQMLGEVVDATVVQVKPFGCFVHFSVELAGGEQKPLVGLVHCSEVAWDPAADVLQAVRVGQRLRAKIVHVDAAEDKRRIFLSIRRTTSNPLLETLDSLVTASAAAASATAGGGPSSSHGDGPGSRPDSASDSDAGAPAGAPLDQRAALGDLPETLRFCELLLQGGRGAVTSAVPGVRLQSRAASQELEVYLAKDAAAGIGAAVAAASGGTGEAAPAAAPAAGQTFNLVLRKGQAVQEVAVVASCSRDEIRQRVAAAVTELVGVDAAAAAMAP